MEIPIELQNLLTVGVEIVVVFLLTQLAKTGFNFDGYKAQIVAAIVSALLVVIQSALAKIPAEFVPLAGALLNVLVVLLGSFGLYKLYRQKFPKQAAG